MTVHSRDKLVISALDRSFNRSGFDCGDLRLNEFIARDARRQQQQDIGRTWIAHRRGSLDICGYYTISTASVRPDQLPREHVRHLPNYEAIGCALIGRLAVSVSEQSRGVGKFLLRDSLRRVLRISADISINAVLVDAINERAAGFYRAYGFIEFPSTPRSLFIPLSAVRKAGLDSA